MLAVRIFVIVHPRSCMKPVSVTFQVITRTGVPRLALDFKFWDSWKCGGKLPTKVDLVGLSAKAFLTNLATEWGDGVVNLLM